MGTIYRCTVAAGLDGLSPFWYNNFFFFNVVGPSFRVAFFFPVGKEKG